MQKTAAIHPLARPAERLLFAPGGDRYGVRLALVFGNHAPGGRCPYWAAGKCLHCDIGEGEGAAFTAELNRQRLAWYREHYRAVVPEVGHLVLYNSGSLLNRQEMPADLLDEILSWTRTLPKLRVVSLETREGAVTGPGVRRVADATGAGRTARLVLGLETSDDRLRDQVLAKRMPRAAVKRAVDAVRAVAGDLGSERIGLTFNILIGGPGTTATYSSRSAERLSGPVTTAPTALDDALGTARFALELGRDAGISVDLNLHPYYRSARGESHFPAHPRCSPQAVARAASAIAELAFARVPPSGLFIGTNDEGHDRDPAPPDADEDAMRNAFERFNRLQDPSVLLEFN